MSNILKIGQRQNYANAFIKMKPLIESKGFDLDELHNWFYDKNLVNCDVGLIARLSEYSNPVCYDAGFIFDQLDLDLGYARNLRVAQVRSIEEAPLGTHLINSSRFYTLAITTNK